MASAVLGKVSPTPKGEYVSTQDYARLDVVTYEGYPYLAKSNVPSGNLPTDELYWMPLLTNLDFAPGGYGLGEYAKHVSSAEIDRTVLNGFYQLSNSITVDGVALYYPRMVVIAGDEKNLIQELYSIVGNNKLRRQCENSVWQPWEWENPPMQLGVEYRTTKRCEGKPVYAKRISLGALPNNSEKTVSYEVIGYTPVSHEETFVSTSGWKLCTYPDIVVIPNGDGYCTVKTTADFSMYTGYTTLEYVKD